MPTPTPGPRRRGVALGVLGLMLLAFFSLVFMMGRHSYWHNIYEEVVHPFDPHPEGIIRHDKATVVSTKDTDPVVKPVEETQKSDPPKAEPKAASKPPPRAERPKATTTKSGEEGLTQLDKDYKPTRDMVQKIAQDGYLVVTWANWHYQDFVNTWVRHVQNVGITGYIVGAMDDRLLQWLIDEKLHCFSMKSGLTLGDFGWGSSTFAKMGREKIKLIRVFLQLGVDVIISDVDVLWLRNPIPFFQQYKEADVLTSSDHLDNTVSGYELERWPHAASAANIGIMLFRNKSMEFVNKWIDIIEKDATVWDQNAFNDLFRQGLRDLPDDKQHLFLGYNGALKMGILPVSVFGSGHTFFTQRMWKKLKLEPYALHATFQFSGTPGKRHRMREFMLFEDPPEYYDHKEGFLSFEFDGLEELLKTAGPNTGKLDLPNVQGHFKLVNHEIARIRNALAVATLTGRALIVPQLWCGQDRWWAPHSGRIPGSSFELPFPCPMDHVFDLEGGWTRPLPVDQFGPNVEFREYSFLENPRTPAAVKSSKLVVEVCAPGTAGCADGSAPGAISGDKLRLQAGLASDKLKTALSSTSKYKVIHFNTMAGVFTNFTSPGDWTKFFNRIRIYGSIWCCIAAHPGHIHYDPWFDIPHQDKFGKQVDKWEPKCGP